MTKRSALRSPATESGSGDAVIMFLRFITLLTGGVIGSLMADALLIGIMLPGLLRRMETL